MRHSHAGEVRRTRRFHRRIPVGAPPGTLAADPDAPPTRVRVLVYGPETVHEEAVDEPQRLPAMLGRDGVVWVQVEGLGDAALIEAIGDTFGLHRLALEDVLHVHQRAKIEAYGDRLFIVTRMVDLGRRVSTEQLSMFLGPGFVVSFQERPSDRLDPVRDRIRAGRGRIRASGPDYLAYAIIDTALDHYFPVLEEIGERLELLEDDVVLRVGPEVVDRIHAMRRDLLALRRAVWPQREALGSIVRDPNPLVGEDTRIYLRDTYDHTIQIIDLLENYREIGSALMDVYLSSINNRMSDVMKTLTLVATIFIPLTFIAGIYGMNFDPQVSPWNMPELEWYLGYPAALLFMAAVGVGLFVWFKRRRWI